MLEKGNVAMIADRIREIREANGLSQAELARRLSVTRASVSAWEMGVSAPTAQYVVAMAQLFHVTTDSILDVTESVTLNLAGLTPQEMRLVCDLVGYIQARG